MPRTPRPRKKSSVFPTAQSVRAKIERAQAELSDLRKLLRFLVRLEKLHAEVEVASSRPVLVTRSVPEIVEEGD